MSKASTALAERLLDFSVGVLRLVDSIADCRAGNHIRGQLLRCGTAVSSNYAEAQDAESKADFIHKIKVVLKELRETKVWLMMMQRTETAHNELLDPLIDESNELIAIFVQSVKTARMRP